VRAFWTDAHGRRIECWAYAEFTGADGRQMVVVQHWDGGYHVLEREAVTLASLARAGAGAR